MNIDSSALEMQCFLSNLKVKHVNKGSDSYLNDVIGLKMNGSNQQIFHQLY